MDGWPDKTRNVNMALETVVGMFYYLQSQSASPVLVQHCMANENFIRVGSYMMPYASDRRDNDEQIRGKKRAR